MPLDLFDDHKQILLFLSLFTFSTCTNYYLNPFFRFCFRLCFRPRLFLCLCPPLPFVFVFLSIFSINLTLLLSVTDVGSATNRWFEFKRLRTKFLRGRPQHRWDRNCDYSASVWKSSSNKKKENNLEHH